MRKTNKCDYTIHANAYITKGNISNSGVFFIMFPTFVYEKPLPNITPYHEFCRVWLVHVTCS